MDVAGAWASHVNPAFVRLLGVLGYGRVWTRAQDVWVWDDQDRRHLDALANFGASSLGHNHPRLHAAIRAHLASSPLALSHLGPSPHAASLAVELARRFAPLTVSLFASSGAEGVEAAIKLAVAATGRHEVLCFDGGFHGTSLGALAWMGAPRMRAPFEKLLAPVTRVAYGSDTRSMLTSRRFAAVLVEPLQAEGGVRLPPAGWLDDLAQACRATGTVLVFDEVQSGLGRLGAACHPVTPDVRVFGKALGGGILPVSVAQTTPELHARAYGGMDRFDLHSSTYGGAALGCAVASEVLTLLDEVTPTVLARGARLRDRLRDALAEHPFVREVRGEGLLVAVELGPARGVLSRLAPSMVEGLSRQVFGQWLAVRLLEAGVLAQPAALAWNVLRLEPPLTIDDAGVDLVADAVIGILSEYTSLPTLLADVGQRLGEQAWRGGAFR